MRTPDPASVPIIPAATASAGTLPSVERTTLPRRAPTQRRSRERLERLLAAAASLIEERGSDAMRMSDVAETAGVSIGSLYQYFPDKAAIIRTLAERFNADGRTCVELELRPVHNEAELSAAMEQIVDKFYGMFLAQPVMRDIWSGTQADKALQAMDAAEGRAHGKLLLDVWVRLRPAADPAGMATLSFLLMHLMESTVRLAISVERTEGDALIDTFKRMMHQDIRLD